MKYHKREITYDDKTQNFKITVPELGLEVLGDTEMGALLEMRKEVTAAAKRPKKLEVKSEMPMADRMRGMIEDIYLPSIPPDYSGGIQSRGRSHRITTRGCPQCLYPGAKPPRCSHCGYQG